MLIILGQLPHLLQGERGFIFRYFSYVDTERSYWDWIKRFIKFHKLRHPDLLTGDDVRDFLTHLVMKKHVAVSTQQQALSALVFLYKQVLGRDSFTINDWQKSILGFPRGFDDLY